MQSLFPEASAPAPDDLARAMRLWAIGRGGRVPALARGGLNDPVTLSRLGLHTRGADKFMARPGLCRRWTAEAVASLLATGRRDEATRLADVSRVDGKRLALALAGFDAVRALACTPRSEIDLRAALAHAAGDVASPAESAEGRLASGQGAASDWADIFRQRGMSPVTALDRGPVTVHTALASAQRVEDDERVSVVMPVWNTASHVGAAVRSILDQGWRNLELIVVDDSSSDESIAAVVSAGDGDPRLRVLHQSARRGPYVARNRALGVATGRWVAFHDADEWAHPDRLRVQIGEMRRRGLVASAGRGVRIDDEGSPRARGVWPLVRLAPSTLMIDRVPVLARAGMMHEVGSGADSEYWWRMSLLFGPARVAFLPNLLTLGAWRAASQTVSAKDGYGSGGVNLHRLAYWEAWNLWHLSARRNPDIVKLEAGQQPFYVPSALRTDTAEVKA